MFFRFVDRKRFFLAMALAYVTGYCPSMNEFNQITVILLVIGNVVFKAQLVGLLIYASVLIRPSQNPQAVAVCVNIYAGFNVHKQMFIFRQIS